MNRHVLLAAASALALAAPAAAQTAGSASVTGIVQDDGRALPGAVVSIEGASVTAVTDAKGAFRLVGLAAGDYTLTISSIGFGQTPVTVSLAADETENLGVIAVEPASVEQIVVRGNIITGERRALNIQKTSDNIINVLSADGIGKLPDRNAAEAVQRIPGVAIERDQSEGRFVAVRGLPSQWNSTLINGNRLPTAEEETTSRATAFDFFPSELIERVEVSKALTPDQEGDAIGGAVNFVTRTAPTERTLLFTGGLGYSEKAESGSHLFSATYGDRFDNFGFLLNGTLYSRDWATDNFEPRRGGDGVGIRRLELRDYTGVRETLGLNAAAEYNFDNGGQVFGRAIYGTLEDDETHYKHRYRFDRDRVEVQHIFNTLITELSGFEGGGEHPVGGKGLFDWKLATYENQFYYGDTPDAAENAYFVVRFDQSAVGYTGLENRGSGNLAYLEADGGSDPARAISTHLPDGFVMDPALTRLAEVELYKVEITERDKIVAEANYEHTLGNGIDLKFGGKYRDKERNAFFEDLFYGWNPAAGPVPTLADFSLINQPGRNGFLDELDLGSTYAGDFSQVVSEDEIVAWYLANRQNLVLLEGDSAIAANGGSLGRDFDLEEQHAAAYAMGTWERGPWTVVGGVRLEQTDTTVDGRVLENGVLVDVSESSDYLSTLPSLHVTYRLDEDTNVRGAITRTFARPDFGDLAPGGAFSEADLEFFGGNPSLSPTYSNNIDVLFERFYSDVGVLSAGVFYKDITDPIFDSRRTGTYRDITGVTFFTPDNGVGGYLYGLEFNAQRRLTWLPGLFSNLGVNANYTWIDSEFELPSGRTASVPRQADNLFNAAVFYDDGQFSSRLALNYKGAYIEEYGDSADTDSYYGEYTSLDFTLNYNIGDRVTVFGEATNLLNDDLNYYLGTEDRPLQVEYYGPRAIIGVKVKAY